MAKRFTDTNKYKKPFLRGLLGPYKLLWDYIYHDCDHAGIWIVDFEIAQIYLGKDMVVNKEDALKNFNSDKTRILEVDDNSKWFLPGFILFQYGELNENNRVHNSVISQLKKYGIWKSGENENDKIKALKSPLESLKNKDKIKNKSKAKDKKKEPEKINFAEFVNMQKKEYDKLIEKHGKIKTDEFIEILDNYKGANNKKYDSDYRAILSWVIEKHESKKEPSAKIFMTEKQRKDNERDKRDNEELERTQRINDENFKNERERTQKPEENKYF